MKLLIIGAGYVGLVTGTCMAEMGHQVTCLDIDREKIDLLRSGRIPFYEPGLEELVKRNLLSKRLQFSDSYSESVASSDVCFICVHTPMSKSGEADLTYVRAVALEIAAHMDSYKVIINKSTVPVGTAAMVKALVAETLQKRGLSVEFDVVSNPEFLTEGCAVSNCMKPDRVILGVDNPRVALIVKEIYSPFMVSHDRLFIMEIPSAEMTKYAANAMLASRVSLMNELAAICEEVGASIDDVRVGIGSDARIGYKFIYAGCGFGGSCLPKDLRALRALGQSHGAATTMLDAIGEVNERQKGLLARKIIAYFEERGGLKGKSIGLLGLSFKPDTDDMRQAPSLTLIEQLLAEGAKLKLFDPVAMERAKRAIPLSKEISFVEDEMMAAEGVDALALLTEWKQFRLLDFEGILAAMRGRAFFDGRNQYSPEKMAAYGFDYISIGKRPRIREGAQNELMTTAG